MPCRHIRVMIQLHLFFTSAMNGGERSLSCPGHYTPGERAPATHSIQDWVGPIAVVDVLEKSFLPPSNPRSSSL